ncbi:hypothetical protein [Corynebacterium halotolerans]|uniref:Uncharacterized protein n=1 Tax=Corynebacterium halotolerans YIM 70093 = DSM 44683 TaxID=1121362 RepID=M1NPY2_9CORY|nr:hypothetical protein [Corynebacterium halotolerans]AGF73443.1 hypothetical protein A605_12235 [Corynebacterium halotolerans YIM 70093 = DSM 44683]
MQAPRLRVGVLGEDPEGHRLGRSLAEVGHTVDMLEDPEAAADLELVIVSASAADLPALVEQLSARARRGQIYLHTCLALGVQVFDPLEPSGAVVVAAHPLSKRLWAVGAADELGETIVELLVGELGGNALVVSETQRARLAAGMTYAGFIETVRKDAVTLLAEALGNVDHAQEIVDSPGTRRALGPVAGPGGVVDQQKAIEDPGLARAFRELARRTAELTRVDDVELWAIQEERP